MEKNTIIESVQQTADKLVVELKETCPGVIFDLTVQEEKDIQNDVVPHIVIEWTDGPTSQEVEKIAYKYQSTDDAQFERPHGYLYNGQHYIGAYYILPERQITQERKSVIMEVAKSFGYTEKTVSNFQMDLWEEELVEKGKLSK